MDLEIEREGDGRDQEHVAGARDVIEYPVTLKQARPRHCCVMGLLALSGEAWLARMHADLLFVFVGLKNATAQYTKPSVADPDRALLSQVVEAGPQRRPGNAHHLGQIILGEISFLRALRKLQKPAAYACSHRKRQCRTG